MQRNNAGILRWPQRPNEKRIVMSFYLLLVLVVGLLASFCWFGAAEAIGEAAGSFIQEDLKMGLVYDYMFHVLNAYAKLLRFKPTVPSGAVEVCAETMACPAIGKWKKFMEESMVMSPSDSNPCTMPPPYDPESLRDVFEKKENATKQAEKEEIEYWDNLNKHQ